MKIPDLKVIFLAPHNIGDLILYKNEKQKENEEKKRE